MNRLYLDDVRDPPSDEQWIVVRSFTDAVDHVTSHGIPDFISFDHDLGENVPTGQDFAKWLIECHLDGKHEFPKTFGYAVHSANPPGATNIASLLDSFMRWLSHSESQ
jgi:hypothetical protein